jgi:hypothetical protein
MAYLDVGLREAGDVEQEGVLAGRLYDVHRRSSAAADEAMDVRVPVRAVVSLLPCFAAVAVRRGDAVEHLRQVEQRVEQLSHGFPSPRKHTAGGTERSPACLLVALEIYSGENEWSEKGKPVVE